MKKITLLVIFFITSYSYSQSSQSVLFMDKENGVYTLPCKVNGIPMKFIFDTGASNVSISLTEAQFLAKQGLLNDDEIFGSVKYQIANGEVKEGTRIVLSQIEIGQHVLNNVEAFITHELNSPLLLGQSAISKLGKIEIEGNKLVITTVNPRNRFEFLNIDLSKHINDFGYSAWDLQQPLNPYELETIQKDNYHFLSRYEFDKEVVLFSESGFIPIILLQKTFTGGNYQSDNEEKAKLFFEEITQVITEKYGSYSTKNARVIEWNSPDYQMMLNLTSDNIVVLTYNNLNIKYFEKSKKTVSKDDSSNNDEVKIVHTEEVVANSLMDFFNDFLEVLKQEEVRSFARLENNILKIYFEKSPQVWPSHEDVEMRREIQKLEQQMIRNYSEFVVLNSFKTKKDLQVLNNSNIKTIMFILDISYADNSKSRLTKQVSANTLIGSRIPISKNDFFHMLTNQ